LFDQTYAPENLIYPNSGDNLIGTPKPSNQLLSSVISFAVSAVASGSELDLLV
jgi:hypothetical protein